MSQESAPVDRAGSVDRVHAELRARVLDGTFLSGAVLSVQAVADRLGADPELVREAFRRLSDEGYLQLVAERGALVAPVSLDEARCVLEARLLIELFALDTVAARGHDELRRLGERLRALEGDVPLSPSPSSAQALVIGRAFHAGLVEACGNTVLASMHATLWAQGRRVSAASIADPGHAAEDIAEHEAIALAMRAGHGAEARELLHRHISAVLRRLGLGDEFTLPRPAGS
ncbi:GntR family transcriptional regulator [Streptomyces varsoviensis]|uniref:GntR family transcriptional regulator n=1 Tax=Streptomyces varsoviensis TaxID=67373 RepID=UPI0033F33E10